MARDERKINRRGFLKTTAVMAAPLIVPRHVLGGPDQIAPSDTFGGALIGCNRQGPTTFSGLGPGVKMLARCDVTFKNMADDKTIYTDFRKVLERKDIDVVAIATNAGWHALISIAAMEAGKDVFCDRPMCRFIAEGRAVAEAEKRYNRMFQIGTYGRFGANRKMRKIFESGLLKQCDTVLIQRGGLKVRAWIGKVRYKVEPVPSNLDWDMYCGPAPLRPYQSDRGNYVSCRLACCGYWDYAGGGLADMAHHYLDGPCYQYGRNLTSPVEITPYAPPMHPECCMLWGWCEMKYADGFTLVIESQEWGPRYDRLQVKNTGESDIRKMLSEEDQKKLDAMPDSPPLLSFADAIRKRKPAGGNAAASHRVASIYHLMNIAMRCGRTIRFDPVKDEVIGDEEANRLANQPMRAPWRL